MVSIHDITPGMKVQLISQHEDTFGEKRKWLGKVVTVRNVYPDGIKFDVRNRGRPCFNAVEDKELFQWGRGWPWFADHIECIVEDPENQPIDTGAFDSLII